ncbi:hypothetical protein TNCV_3914921 [Trichonephila clavipes]|nr:hypothetical protein TNCV_3914921 [Trichonephila clavipes]
MVGFVGKTRPLPGHSSIGFISTKHNFVLACLHPLRSPTREAVCRSSDKYQARRLPGVHPEYSTAASGRGSNGSGREKNKKRNFMTRERVENREGSLGYPGFVKPVFTKDSKPPWKKENITRAPRDCDTRTHLKKISFNHFDPDQDSLGYDASNLSNFNRFGRLIDEVPRDLPGVYAIVDDILVVPKDQNEHLEHFKMLFSKLQEYGLCINAEKCFLKKLL